VSTPRNISLQAFPSQRSRDPAAARRAHLRQYAKGARAFLNEHPWCAVFPQTMRATHRHHVFGRQGALLNWKPGWLAVSLRGHQVIDANKDWARVAGFLAPPGLWNVTPEKILERIQRDKLWPFYWVLDRAGIKRPCPVLFVDGKPESFSAACKRVEKYYGNPS
jgi:hypothetical protein